MVAGDEARTPRRLRRTDPVRPGEDSPSNLRRDILRPAIERANVELEKDGHHSTHRNDYVPRAPSHTMRASDVPAVTTSPTRHAPART